MIDHNGDAVCIKSDRLIPVRIEQATEDSQSRVKTSGRDSEDPCEHVTMHPTATIINRVNDLRDDDVIERTANESVALHGIAL